MPVPPRSRGSEDPLTTAKVIYGLLGLGVLVAITCVIGIIIAYASRGKSDILDTHLNFQIRTFWITVAMAAAALVTTLLLGLGFLLLAVFMVWGLARTITGFLLAADGKPVTATKYWGAVAY